MALNIVPDEMYVLLHHDGEVEGFPDLEEVDWAKMDKEYAAEPGPRFSYKRQGQRVKPLPAPSAEAWRAFLERLDEIGVFSWRNAPTLETRNRFIGYEPPVWVFELKRPGMKPFRRKGPIEKLPPNFDKFCEALSELMGGQSFGGE